MYFMAVSLLFSAHVVCSLRPSSHLFLRSPKIMLSSWRRAIVPLPDGGPLQETLGSDFPTLRGSKLTRFIPHRFDHFSPTWTMVSTPDPPGPPMTIVNAECFR